MTRFKKVKWGKGQPRVRTGAERWKNPVKWNLAAGKLSTEAIVKAVLTPLDKHRAEASPCQRARVFPSLCDWLDDEVPVEWLADFLKLIHDTPHLDWLLLTKRPENFFKRLRGAWNATVAEFDSFERWLVDWKKHGVTPANVWIGTSVEDQERAEERIPELLKIPARVRFLSVEPLLEAVDLKLDNHCNSPACLCAKIDWVIVGGESGAKARPCHVEWIGGVVEQCQAAGVPCFVKQLGSNSIGGSAPKGGVGTHFKMPLKHPKGGDPAEWPEDLRVREFPGVDHL